MKNIVKKVGLAEVFTKFARRGVLSEEASIYIAEMTAIRIAQKMSNIYKYS